MNGELEKLRLELGTAIPVRNSLGAFADAIGQRLGSGLISSGPKSCGGESDGGEECDSELLEAGGDASEVFELVEVSLDEVALAVDCTIHGALYFPVPLCRDMGLGAAGIDPLDQRHRIIATVSHDLGRAGETVDQGRRGGLVAGLSGADRQADRQARLVHNRMDLGA